MWRLNVIDLDASSPPWEYTGVVYWPALFEAMLEGWVTVESMWPKARTFEMFNEWFEVQTYRLPRWCSTSTSTNRSRTTSSAGWCIQAVRARPAECLDMTGGQEGGERTFVRHTVDGVTADTYFFGVRAVRPLGHASRTTYPRRP